MLELRKRHLKKCRKYQPGSPFSGDLDCKRCPYYAFGRLNGQKVRQSSETTDRREAAQKLLEMEAEAKAPARYTVSEAVNRFVTELEGSGYAPKSAQRYKYSLKRLTDFLTAFQRRARNVLPCLQGTRNLRFGQGSI